MKRGLIVGVLVMIAEAVFACSFTAPFVEKAFAGQLVSIEKTGAQSGKITYEVTNDGDFPICIEKKALTSPVNLSFTNYKDDFVYFDLGKIGLETFYEASDKFVSDPERNKREEGYPRDGRIITIDEFSNQKSIYPTSLLVLKSGEKGRFQVPFKYIQDEIEVAAERDGFVDLCYSQKPLSNADVSLDDFQSRAYWVEHTARAYDCRDLQLGRFTQISEEFSNRVVSESSNNSVSKITDKNGKPIVASGTRYFLIGFAELIKLQLKPEFEVAE